IEIMVSLVISSLLVAMILSIFTSMSAAYRSQQQVAELQQVLQAAEATIEADLRQTGYRCAQGFTWAGSPAAFGASGVAGTQLVPALNITDGGTGPQQPDQIAIYYGDPSSQAQVMPNIPAGNLTQLTVDAVDPTWRIGDRVLFTVQSTISHPSFEAVRPVEEP